MDKDDKKVQKVPLPQSLQKLTKDLVLVKRGLRDLGILPKIETSVERMKEEYWAHNYQECLNLCDEILKFDSVSSESFYKSIYYKGDCLCRLKKYEEAIIWINKTLEHYQNNIHYLDNEHELNDAYLFFLKAGSLYELNRYEEALVWFDKVLENYSDNDTDTTLGIYGKARCLYELGRYEEALVWFDKTLERNLEYQLTDESHKEDCLEKRASCIEKLGKKVWDFNF